MTEKIDIVKNKISTFAEGEEYLLNVDELFENSDDIIVNAVYENYLYQTNRTIGFYLNIL